VLQGPTPELLGPALHVWQFPTTISESAYAGFAELLSPDERTRAARFHFEKDARRFVVARASLRSILTGYTLSPAAGLRFADARHGKPGLIDAARDIRFNLSHSGDQALLAVALGREVGADVEAIRTDVETDKLAERFFSAAERQALRALPPERRVAAFFRCWTCKEAFLKAQGIGLSRSLGSFDVDVNPGHPARLVATRPDPSEAGRWSLHELEAPPGYAAALAVEGAITALSIVRCGPA